MLILGGIHGNEPCGTRALLSLRNKIEKHEITLSSGNLTIVPFSNPEACKQNKRYIDYDANRLFGKTDEVSSAAYELKLIPELKTLIENCDLLLDLHSFSGKGAPFIFKDYDDEVSDTWSRSLGIEHIISGWPALDFNKGKPAYDTSYYAHINGKPALTVECGHHNDENSVIIAEQVILKSLLYADFIAQDDCMQNISSKSITVNKAYLKPAEGRFAKDWKNLDKIKKGDLLAYEADKEIRAMIDGYILMPKENAVINEEWFFTAHS